MQKQRAIIRAIILAMCGAGCGKYNVAQADLLFMPGDAFFHSELTSDFLEGLPADGGNLFVPYSPPPSSFALGGYAGFLRIEIKDVSPSMISALRKVYAEQRKFDAKIVRIGVDADGKGTATEMNGFHLFIYNRSVKFTKQQIGNKYNENWMNLPAQAITPTKDRPSGLGTSHANGYFSFLSSPKSIVDDWRNAARFQELKVRVPSGIPWGITGPPISEPVSVDAKDIQFVICPYDDLSLYFQQADDVDFFTITVDGVKRFVWKNEDYVEEWEDKVKGNSVLIQEELTTSNNEKDSPAVKSQKYDIPKSKHNR